MSNEDKVKSLIKFLQAERFDLCDILVKEIKNNKNIYLCSGTPQIDKYVIDNNLKFIHVYINPFSGRYLNI